MIYPIIGLSLIFIIIGFVITEKNARYLLAGYNTMPKEAQDKIDIKSYISYFRNFQVFLGISFLLIGTILYFFISKNASGIFLAVYPLLAYIYFIWTSRKLSTGQDTTQNKIAAFVLIGVLILVIGLLGIGYRANNIDFNKAEVKIDGIYGTTLQVQEIQSIELINNIPPISIKTNGFALGEINKGYFKTTDGETVKLILNSSQRPVIIFTTTEGQKIYYNLKDDSTEALFKDLQEAFPNTATIK